MEEEEAIRSRSKRRRSPLSDCTNSIYPLQSSSSTKNSSTIIKGTKTPTSAQNDNNPSNPNAVSLPFTSTPSRPSKPSSTSGTGSDLEAFELCSVYGRRHSADRRKKSNRKAFAVPMSCFRAEKTHFAGDERNEGGTSLSKSCTLPCKKKQQQTTSKEDVANHALPQDFIEQQRAYFAEIDAFELPEEEVASIHELD